MEKNTESDEIAFLKLLPIPKILLVTFEIHTSEDVYEKEKIC